MPGRGEALPQKIDTENRKKEGQAWEGGSPPHLAHESLGVIEHRTPAAVGEIAEIIRVGECLAPVPHLDIGSRSGEKGREISCGSTH
jgi:hypothetical protein